MYLIYFLIFEDIKQLSFSKLLDPIFLISKSTLYKGFFKGIIDLLYAKKASAIPKSTQ